MTSGNRWADYVDVHTPSREIILPKWLNRVVDLDTLSISEFNNVYARGSSICKTHRRAFDSFFDSTGAPITSCRYYRGDTVNAITYNEVILSAIDSTIPTYDNVLYLGLLHPHYGHFITESLSRAWALALLDPELHKYSFYFDVHNNKVDYNRDLGWAYYILSCLHVPKDRIILGTHQCSIRRLVVPSQSLTLHRSCSPLAHASIWNKICISNDKAFVDRLAGSSYSQGIFISRSLLARNKRAMICEPLLEDLAQSKGLKVIHPQQLSIQQQIKVYSSASTIIGQAGSGLHNILFAQDGCNLIGIDSGEHVLMNDSLCALMAKANHKIIIHPDLHDKDLTRGDLTANDVISMADSLL
jgi:hypothetical protein